MDLTLDEVRRRLAPALPPRAALRAIPAFVPFTASEGAILRAGFLEDDTRWILIPNGGALDFWRVPFEGPMFFWRLELEDRAGACVLTRLWTRADATKGEFFASDANQVGAAWSVVEGVMLKKQVWHQEDFYWGAAQLLARSAGTAAPLALKAEVWSQMIQRAEERMGPER